eukprot:CAMPEP_0202893616 /NCGR_PEP_ID=MMETSP1392-20130828/3163_1 /ASSEMBLY_ACC=CAM_ASM_000868 /TAXON_ID=225041 /ORGANISM="Chlamydomonas chlamydogama, Strain SAG 11-48b" /LENGTH=35 /DNA_ID= /DNA_START= /DNA_END= /DNA_ORIENTATION=
MAEWSEDFMGKILAASSSSSSSSSGVPEGAVATTS